MRTVFYTMVVKGAIAIGNQVTLIPLNHPDTKNVQNGMPAITSVIRTVYADGTSFETYNTIYKQWIIPYDLVGRRVCILERSNHE